MVKMCIADSDTKKVNRWNINLMEFDLKWKLLLKSVSNS